MILTDVTSSKIIIDIKDVSGKKYILQRAFYLNKTWLTLTSAGFVQNPDSSTEILELDPGICVDEYELENGLYEYRYVSTDVENPQGSDYVYSEWVKFGKPEAIGYTFNNYRSPENSWGTVVTPDDCRYTYLWGTDFKATNGQYFTDEQIQWFIDEATLYMERELNLAIKKCKIVCDPDKRNLKKTTKFTAGDYDEEEAYYEFSWRKIQRYGMIKTRKRPIIKVNRIELLDKGSRAIDLSNSMAIDKKQGTIKYLTRPYKPSQTYDGISTALGRFGRETFEPHLFYAIDYEAGYEKSDLIPDDLRQIIGKVAAISLLNIVGDGLMAGFSSSSLSMDGVSESFSSTQSATSATFGARIAVYQKEVEKYIQDNKYKFGNQPIANL